jgi:hypothetical protein
MSSINPLAVELNGAIKNNNEYIFDMLSEFGLRIYFPKEILSQGAEARAQANRTNATIGIATERGEPMHLQSVHRYIDHISPKDLFDYAPASGKPELREALIHWLLFGLRVLGHLLIEAHVVASLPSADTARKSLKNISSPNTEGSK